MKSKPSHDRNKDNTTITVALSKDLLKMIDEVAIEEQRNRSNFIVYHLTRIVKKAKAAPKE
jgi:metal-responsive CopG/Arc/MetJ family transcriptional regulator